MAKGRTLVEFGSCSSVAFGTLTAAGRYDMEGKVYYSGKLEVMGGTHGLALNAETVELLKPHIGKRLQVSGKLLGKPESGALKFSVVDSLQDGQGRIIWTNPDSDELQEDAGPAVGKPASPFKV